MSLPPLFLTVEQVLVIHERVIVEFGGDPALLDGGLLESAVMMPAAWFQREFLHPDIATMAAAYLFHLCMNHPFADGNKRTALAAAEVFLRLNDHELPATNDELERLTWAVAQGRLDKDGVVAFYRSRVAPSDG